MQQFNKHNLKLRGRLSVGLFTEEITLAHANQYSTCAIIDQIILYDIKRLCLFETKPFASYFSALANSPKSVLCHHPSSLARLLGALQ